MEPHVADRVVALGASAGGPLVLGDVLSALPEDVDAAVVVVLHLLADHPSLLPQVLARRTQLPVVQAADGQLLEPGQVYVAPPDAHLTVDPVERRVVLDRSAPLRYHRPSIDVTLTSLADAFGARTIAVVLSGTGTDGAAGAEHVHAAGGTVLAQDAAEFAAMPQAAFDTGAVDRFLPLREIAPAIVELVGVAAV